MKKQSHKDCFFIVKLKNAIRCRCWYHVRWKFVDVLLSDKELLATSAAVKGLEYCNQLFMLEDVQRSERKR